MSVHSYFYHRKKYFYFRCLIDGKQYSRRFDEASNRFSTEKDAFVSECIFIQEHKNIDKTVSDYFPRFYEDFVLFVKQKYRSTTSYPVIKSFDKYIYRFVKDKKVSDIDSDVFIRINDFINGLDFINKKPIVSAAKNLILFLRRYNVFVNTDVITLERKFVVGQIKPRLFWTFEEFKQFINVVLDPYWKLLFSVLYYYGLRISELRGLRKANFNKERIFICECITNKAAIGKQSVVPPKTKSSIRSLPMFPAIYELFLKNCDDKQYNRSDLVFPSKQDVNMAIGESSVRRKLVEYCNQANVKLIRIHDFRHSCASLLINNGMDALLVANWLGHSSPTITLTIYSHLFETRKREVYEFFNNLQKEK